MYLINRLNEIFNFFKKNGLNSTFKRYIYFNKEWVVVKKNLNSIDNGKSIYTNDELKLINFDKDIYIKDMLHNGDTGEFYRLMSYLDKGYHGYFLKKLDKVIGYIWYTMIGEYTQHNHPDVKYLDIDKNEVSVYMFSMYISPGERGNNVATYILNSLLMKLKYKGVSKAYAIFDKSNIPALWIHRLLKFDEIKTIKVRQIMFYKFIIES